MRYLTAGESHGKALTGILEGMPAHCKIDLDFINGELKRRQQGYGRGGRQKIESDQVEFTAGIRNLLTLGSPIAFSIKNADYENWQTIMSAESNLYDETSTDAQMKRVTAVRPGHADLVGAFKYRTRDARNILERASARNTASIVVLGALAKLYLMSLGIQIDSYTLGIGGVFADEKKFFIRMKNKDIDLSPVRCPDKDAEKAMMQVIDKAKEQGDTVGGQVRVIVSGVPVGLGSVMKSDAKLDSMLMSALGGMQAVKAVEIGNGVSFSQKLGSQVCDSMRACNGKICREFNNAGGLEGGMTNGEDIVLTLTIKPIPTLMQGAETVDIFDFNNALSGKERSDVSAVVPAGIVSESLAALTIMQAVEDCVGGDTMEQVFERISLLRQRYEDFFKRG